MDTSKTIQWVVTAGIRLVAGYFAVKLGQDAISEQTWASVGSALSALVIAGLSIYSSVKARKTLAESEPPVKPMQP